MNLTNFKEDQIDQNLLMESGGEYKTTHITEGMSLYDQGYRLDLYDTVKNTYYLMAPITAGGPSSSNY